MIECSSIAPYRFEPNEVSNNSDSNEKVKAIFMKTKPVSPINLTTPHGGALVQNFLRCLEQWDDLA